MIRPGVIAVSTVAAVAVLVSGVGGYVGASKVVDWVDESVRADVGSAGDADATYLPIATPVFETRLQGPITSETQQTELNDGFAPPRQVAWVNETCAVAVMDLGADRMASGYVFQFRAEGAAAAVQMRVVTQSSVVVQGSEALEAVMTDGREYAHAVFVQHGRYPITILCLAPTDSRPAELQVAVDSLVLKDGTL